MCLQTIFPFYNTESLNFQSITDSENSFYDIDELNKMAFDPLGTEWEEEEGGVGVMSDIDPDKNYFSTEDNRISNHCLYYHVEDLNKEINKHQKEDSLSLLHMNIRSLKKKFNKLTVFLDSLIKMLMS
jgi:hypothetical protein